MFFVLLTVAFLSGLIAGCGGVSEEQLKQLKLHLFGGGGAVAEWSKAAYINLNPKIPGSTTCLDNLKSRSSLPGDLGFIL